MILKKVNKIAGTEVINSVVHHLQADAEFDGKTIPLHLRTAWSNQDTKDAIYYDMSDEKRRCIKVTKDGWKIVENQIEVLFKRYNHLKPQVEPTITTTLHYKIRRHRRHRQQNVRCLYNFV